VTVYLVIAELPKLAGAVHDTVAAAFPGAATTREGACGVFGDDGVTAALGNDAGEAPAALLAVTVNV
jgi:hypothetical protein